jgi:Protein of unknown function (DUF4232)
MTLRRSRIGARALASTALLAAVCATVAAASASPAPRCQTSGLAIWLNTQGSGAAGSIYYRVELTNLAGRACTLAGYPRVAAVDLGGRQIGKGSERFVSRKPTFQLANGATASFVLQITDVANFPSSACRPTTAAGLRVFPPHEAASKVVPFPFRACSRSTAEYLWAQAVQPHA